MGIVLLIELAAPGKFGSGTAAEGLFGVFDEVSDDAILPQVIDAIGEVFPHEVANEGEGRECGFFGDFEAWDIADSGANFVEDASDVDAFGVVGE